MKRFDRRQFLQTSAKVCAVLPLAYLAACDKGDSGSPPAATEPPATTGPPATNAPAQGGGSTCDLGSLSEAELAPRKALGYVDKTPDPAKTCENCNLYVADAGGCAGCTLFKGPVEPAGYCKSWVAKV